MTSLSKLYTPDVTRVNDFLKESNPGIIVPAFQRPYTWEKVHSNRLFDDILRFIKYLFKSNDLDRNNEEFQILGTAILIEEIKDNVPVPASCLQSLPKCIMSVVDGQQRLTTLIITNLIIYNHLNTLFHEINFNNEEVFGDDGDSKLFKKYLNSIFNDIKDDLQDCFLIDKKRGDKELRYYPKIVRAYDDIWSTDKDHSEYTSPVAKLISEYIKHFYNEETKDNFWDIDNNKFFTNNEDKYENVLSFYKSINERIKEIYKRNNDKQVIQLPTLKNMMNNIIFSRSINVDNNDNSFAKYCEIIEKLKEHNFSKYEKLEDLLTLIYFSKYINEKVIINTLIVKNESSALDLFESLNTTGELLTSFETLVPKVIETEEKYGYKESDTKVDIDNINY